MHKNKPPRHMNRFIWLINNMWHQILLLHFPSQQQSFFVNATSRFVFSRQMSQVLCVYKPSLFTFNNTSSSVLVCYFISHTLKSNLKDMCCKNYWWVVIPTLNQKKACYDWLTNYILHNVKIYTNNTEIGLCQWYQMTK